MYGMLVQSLAWWGAGPCRSLKALPLLLMLIMKCFSSEDSKTLYKEGHHDLLFTSRETGIREVNPDFLMEQSKYMAEIGIEPKSLNSFSSIPVVCPLLTAFNWGLFSLHANLFQIWERESWKTLGQPYYIRPVVHVVQYPVSWHCPVSAASVESTRSPAEGNYELTCLLPFQKVSCHLSIVRGWFKLWNMRICIPFKTIYKHFTILDIYL